jgi:protoheme IX farnesyltransferase
VVGLGGILYAAAALGFGAWMLIDAIAVWRERNEAREPAARKLFGVSILYLFALFAALIAERLIGIAPLHSAGWM